MPGKTMLVRTPPGLKCPKEGQPRSYITDDAKGVEVPETSFYHRLIAERSLIRCTPPAAAAQTSTATSSAQAGPSPLASAAQAPVASAATASAASTKGATNV